VQKIRTPARIVFAVLLSATLQGCSETVVFLRDLNPFAADDAPVRTGSGLTNTIYFAPDTAALSGQAGEVLDAWAEWLGQNPGARILVEGHTDANGTNEYNLALGEKIAQTVKAGLVKRGVAAGRIGTMSFGEEQTAAANAEALPGDRNRRAYIKVVKK
jgi:outer membrane protein OmpA-like peptidoglycan-associated protein